MASYSRVTLVQGTCSAPGLGNFVITDQTGSVSWSTIPDGNKVRYVYQDNPADANREWGLGTKTTSAGSPVVQRTSSGVIGGTNGAGTLVNFTGNKGIIYVAPLGEVDDTPNVTADPIAAVSTLGQRVYRTDTNQLRVYAGSTPAWVNLIRSDGGGTITNVANQIGFTITGFANQTNPILRIGTSSALNMVRFWDPAGNNVAVTINATGAQGGIQINGSNTDPSQIILEARGSSGQTGAIFQVSNNSGQGIFRSFDAAGGPALQVVGRGVNQTILSLQSFSGQAADLIDIQDSNSNFLFSMTSAANVFWKGIDSGSNSRNQFALINTFQDSNTGSWKGAMELMVYDFNQPGGRLVTYAYADGSDSRLNQTAPASAPSDGDLTNGTIQYYLDEGGNNLKVRVKYSNGTLKTGTVSLV